MISNPKKPRKLSSYDRQMVNIADLYIAETGELEYDPLDVVRWAIDKGLIDLPKIDLEKMLAQRLVRACRQDYIKDENGEPVRRRHAVKVGRGKVQHTFWARIEDIKPQQFRISLTSRRNGAGHDLLQIERDKRYYNKHYNPGDPLEMDYDFTPDIEEHFMPTEYPDAPPEDGRS